MAEEKKVPAVPAPEVEKYPDGSPIVKGAAGSQFWPSEAKAIEVANSRQKGARRACMVKDPKGNVRYATCTHPHFLEEYILCTELGYTVEEIGKPARAKAPVTADAMLAAINTLPTEALREEVKKQLLASLGIKLPETPAPAKK